MKENPSHCCDNGMCGQCSSCESDTGDAMTINALRRDLEITGVCVDRLRMELDAATECIRVLERRLLEAETCSRCGAHHNEIRGGRVVVVRSVCAGCVP